MFIVTHGGLWVKGLRSAIRSQRWAAADGAKTKRGEAQNRLGLVVNDQTQTRTDQVF